MFSNVTNFRCRAQSNGGNAKAGAILIAISLEFGKRKGTISKILKQYVNYGSTKHKKGNGRPRCLSFRTDRLLVRKIRQNRWMPATTARHQLPTPAPSLRTIRRRRLAAANLKCRRPVKRPHLTAVHINNRMQWAMAHAHWREP